MEERRPRQCEDEPKVMRYIRINTEQFHTDLAVLSSFASINSQGKAAKALWNFSCDCSSEAEAAFRTHLFFTPKWCGPHHRVPLDMPAAGHCNCRPGVTEQRQWIEANQGRQRMNTRRNVEYTGSGWNGLVCFIIVEFLATIGTDVKPGGLLRLQLYIHNSFSHKETLQ